MGIITGNEEYNLKGAQPLRTLSRLMSQAPGGAAYWLGVLDFYVSIPKEIAIIGPREGADTVELVDAVFGRYLPNKVVVGLDASERRGRRGYLYRCEWDTLTGGTAKTEQPGDRICVRKLCLPTASK